MSMGEAEPERGKIRFGEFEFDPDAGSLKKGGYRVKLATQPAQLLSLLLERRGELVSREELRTQLWGEAQFADSEHSLNVAVAKLREALEDSADNPRFIATVPRRGYRFIGAVTAMEPPVEAPAAIPIPSQKGWRRLLPVAAAMLGIAVLAAFGSRVLYRGAPHPPAGRIRLAVLPFANLSGDSNQEYFCDGLTEEMITALGRLQPDRLGVIARSSVMRYKKGAPPVHDIGGDLGVDYILEGSVRRDGSRARVTAQLVQVKDQSNVWAGTYDRDIRDLISVQSELARAVAGEVGLTLNSARTAGLGRAVDPQAHEEYLRGRYQWNKRNLDGFLKAMKHFQRAIEIDPLYASAYAGLADSYLLLGGTYAFPEEVIPKARAAARKALEIDPNLAEAHTSLGLIAMNYDWDWAASEREYKLALEINPNYPTAHHWYAEFLIAQGRFDQALAEVGKARELDPLSLIIAADTGKILYYARRYPQAIEWFRKVLAEEPDFGEAHFYLVQAYVSSGRLEEALADLNAFQDTGRPVWYLDLRALVLGLKGRRTEARELVSELERIAKREGRNRSTYAGAGYLALGERGKALSAIEETVRRRTVGATSLKVHPILDPLRDDPRFTALLRRVGLEQ